MGTENVFSEPGRQTLASRVAFIFQMGGEPDSPESAMRVFHFTVSRRLIIAALAAAILLMGLCLLDTYLRQLVFGPTIRGEPRCVWENAIRRQTGGQPESIQEKISRWLGFGRQHYSLEELYNDSSMLPVLIEMLDDPNPQVRAACTLAIAIFPSLHDRSALPSLRKRFKEDDEIETSVAAAQAIWHIDKDKEIPLALLKLLDEAEPERRFLAMEALAKISADLPELYPQIIMHAKDPEARVRIAVMSAMRNFGKKGLPVLIDGSGDAEMIVRVSAINVMQEMGPEARDARAAIEACLNDPEAYVADIARNALRAIDPERFEFLKKEQKIK